MRLQGSGGGFCGNRARPAGEKAPQWPCIAFSRGPTTRSTLGFLSPSSVVGSRPGRSTSRLCPRVTGSYRPSGPRRCRRLRRSSGRACRHGRGLHRVPGRTGRVDSLVGGRSLVRHATVCDEPFAAEQAHPTRPGAAGRVRRFHENARPIEGGKGRAFGQTRLFHRAKSFSFSNRLSLA